MDNRQLKIFTGLLVCFFVLGLGCQPEGQREGDNEMFNSKIEKIQSDISADSIETNINKLSSFNTRHTASDTSSDSTGIGAARRWIYNTFQRYKDNSNGRLQVRFSGYTETDRTEIDGPADIVNVVAILPGTQLESKDRIYVVSGHYDSRAADITDNESLAPGANDNGSGTAAVLELARVMANYEFDATIAFIAFAGKEQGLLGSEYYAEQSFLKNRHIAGVINNDIIGNGSVSENSSKPKNRVRVFAPGIPADNKLTRYHQSLLNTGGENDTPSRQLGRFIYRIGKKYVDNLEVDLIYRKDRLWMQGDHMSFLEYNYPGVRLTESDENFGRQHQQADLPRYIDYSYTVEVTKLNAAALTTLADAPAPPRQVEMTIRRQTKYADLQWKGNTEPDFKGYEIVWRKTDAPHWEDSKFIGDTLQYSVEEVAKDDYIFGVRSVDNFGNKSQAVYPVPATN